MVIPRQRGKILSRVRRISIKKFLIMEHDETMRRNKWTEAFRDGACPHVSAALLTNSHHRAAEGRRMDEKSFSCRDGNSISAESLSLALWNSPMDLSRFFHCVTGPTFFMTDGNRRWNETTRQAPLQNFRNLSILGLLGKVIRTTLRGSLPAGIVQGFKKLSLVFVSTPLSYVLGNSARLFRRNQSLQACSLLVGFVIARRTMIILCQSMASSNDCFLFLLFYFLF